MPKGSVSDGFMVSENQMRSEQEISNVDKITPVQSE